MLDVNKKTKLTFFACFIIMLLEGCGPSIRTLHVNTLKPAQVNLGGVRKIAVMGFDGAGGNTVSNKMTAKLVESGYFKVFERAQVANLLKEHEMYMTGLVDEKTAAKLGKMLGAEALVIGSVDNYTVTDEKRIVQIPKVKEKGFHYETKIDRKGNKKTEKVTDYEWYKVNAHATTRRGVVSITFKLVDVESGQIMASKSVSRSWEGVNIVDPDPSHEDSYPTPKEKSITLPDNTAVLGQLVEQVIPEMVELISPHYVTEVRTWIDIDEKAKTAGKLVAAGQYADAFDVLSPELSALEADTVKNQDKLHFIYYDIGVIKEALGEFDNAEMLYKKAVGIKGDGIYINALAGVRKAKEDFKRLKEQNKIK